MVDVFDGNISCLCAGRDSAWKHNLIRVYSNVNLNGSICLSSFPGLHSFPEGKEQGKGKAEFQLIEMDSFIEH